MDQAGRLLCFLDDVRQWLLSCSKLFKARGYMYVAKITLAGELCGR
jgi:hypothetical protein